MGVSFISKGKGKNRKVIPISNTKTSKSKFSSKPARQKSRFRVPTLPNDPPRAKTESLSSDIQDLYEVEWQDERDLSNIFVMRKSDQKIVFKVTEFEEANNLTEDGFIEFFGDTEGLLNHLNDTGVIDTQKAIELEFEDAEKQMKEYFEGFSWDSIENEIDKEDEIRSGDFDPDQLISQAEADEKLKVLFIGEIDSIADRAIDVNFDEAEQEVVQNYLFDGKGQDIIDKHSDDLELFVRDQDVFFVKRLWLMATRRKKPNKRSGKFTKKGERLIKKLKKQNLTKPKSILNHLNVYQ